MSNATEKPFGLQLGAIGFAIASFAVIHAISFIVWLLFADPQVGLWKFYPQPFGVYLFWAILSVIFVGFNFGMHGFSKLKQPMCGIFSTVVTLVLAFGVPMMLIFGYGALDPAFSPANFSGHFAAALIVLVAFYCFGVLANSMDGWPWADAGLKQPFLGSAQILTGFLLTIVGYLILFYPSVASWSDPDKVVMSLPTAIGWFYSIIVFWLTNSLLLELWPYSRINSRAKAAISAFFGNILFGTMVYFVLLALLKYVLIPAEALSIIGPAITLWPAQLGVIINFWMLFWALYCGNAPTSLSTAANRVLRFVITWGLAIGTFVVYTRWFAIHVLNETAIVKGFGGDPLIWFDLLLLVLLIYAVYFGTYGLVRKEQ